MSQAMEMSQTCAIGINKVFEREREPLPGRKRVTVPMPWIVLPSMGVRESKSSWTFEIWMEQPESRIKGDGLRGKVKRDQSMEETESSMSAPRNALNSSWLCVGREASLKGRSGEHGRFSMV